MRMSSKIYLKRGQIWTADLNPGFGREIHKKRPVLIVSADNYNQNTPYVIVIPTSSVIPRLVNPEMVVIGRVKGLDKESVLLPIFIRSIDQERLIKRVGAISEEKMLEVEDALKLVLGMTTLD